MRSDCERARGNRLNLKSPLIGITAGSLAGGDFGWGLGTTIIRQAVILHVAASFCNRLGRPFSISIRSIHDELPNLTVTSIHPKRRVVSSHKSNIIESYVYLSLCSITISNADLILKPNTEKGNIGELGHTILSFSSLNTVHVTAPDVEWGRAPPSSQVDVQRLTVESWGYWPLYILPLNLFLLTGGERRQFDVKEGRLSHESLFQSYKAIGYIQLKVMWCRDVDRFFIETTLKTSSTAVFIVSPRFSWSIVIPIVSAPRFSRSIAIPIISAPRFSTVETISTATSTTTATAPKTTATTATSTTTPITAAAPTSTPITIVVPTSTPVTIVVPTATPVAAASAPKTATTTLVASSLSLESESDSLEDSFLVAALTGASAGASSSESSSLDDSCFFDVLPIAGFVTVFAVGFSSSSESSSESSLDESFFFTEPVLSAAFCLAGIDFLTGDSSSLLSLLEEDSSFLGAAVVAGFLAAAAKTGFLTGCSSSLLSSLEDSFLVVDFIDTVGLLAIGFFGVAAFDVTVLGSSSLLSSSLEEDFFFLASSSLLPSLEDISLAVRFAGTVGLLKAGFCGVDSSSSLLSSLDDDSRFVTDCAVVGLFCFCGCILEIAPFGVDVCIAGCLSNTRPRTNISSTLTMMPDTLGYVFQSQMNECDDCDERRLLPLMLSCRPLLHFHSTPLPLVAFVAL
ncbi:hypothetical protein DBV15_03738 [Temnothorax longispinosus]|uniref:Uncharacterized protein n=1 Tax=Temnothorax longispinosus TaxID=300112 RepID=A0A4S2KVQ8_9HYME|nr:hypothetical protein DBV15_03738 [Temnothorax longispinosus]